MAVATMLPKIFADAGDDGFRFIMPDAFGKPASPGGLMRTTEAGHFVTVVGRGGTGKSFLALQLATHLLQAEEQELTRPSPRRHAAFYFTLEATPRELAQQLQKFSWGEKRGYKMPARDVPQWETEGMHIVSVPSPVAGLPALDFQIRQTIARRLPDIGRIVAIVIDPLGGVTLGDDLRVELSQLKDLSASHGTFLLLLTEDHIFERIRSIEHFSQSIIHLEHDPRAQPPRHLYIQKARNQKFRPGYHQFELNDDRGLRVFPSLQAQSAYAHELLVETDQNRESQGIHDPSTISEPLFRIPLISRQRSRRQSNENFEVRIEPGSVVFLMGPPGTFKQHIASHFIEQASDAMRLYISFKADVTAVTRGRSREEAQVMPLFPKDDAPPRDVAKTIFLDARDPLLTPEEILFRVRNAIIPSADPKPETPTAHAEVVLQYKRAVVWGLRRLSDHPNFPGGKAVQFLEALVTLLKSQEITSLLVDWPDPEKASTLPIVDLSQYILLTRVCRSREGDIREGGRDGGPIGYSRADTEMMRYLWGPEQKRPEHVALLRVQRTPAGLRRDLGIAFFRQGPEPEALEVPRERFERYWRRAGVGWEQDPALVH